MRGAGYIVFEPPASAEGGEPVFVRDGFHLLAFLVPMLWFLWHRMWIEALAALVLVAGLAALEQAPGFGMAGPALSLLASIGFGLEAPALRMAALARRGYREWGVVAAASREEAEIRYFGERAAAALHTAPAAPPPAMRPQATRPAAPAGPALGLLHYPGGT